MRLIDLDEFTVPCMETTVDQYHVENALAEQPTVDAIPIEWIEKRIEGLTIALTLALETIPECPSLSGKELLN